MGRQFATAVSSDMPILEEDALGTSRSSSMAFSNFQSATAAAPHGNAQQRQEQRQEQQPMASPPPPREGMLAHKTYSRHLQEAYQRKDEAHATAEGRVEELHAHHRAHASWRLYRTLCQFRFGYLAFLVVLVILVFSFTLLMEIFFAIFLPSAKYDDYYIGRAVALLVLLPLVLFFLSYLFEEAWRLFLDAINKADGSLPNFRLSLAVVIHYLRHRKEINADDDPADDEAAAEDALALEAEAAAGNDTALSPASRQSCQSRASMSRRARMPRKSLLLTARSDPFLDDDKEEEDEAWERSEERRRATELRQQAAAPAPASSEQASGGANTSAASRWKRAKAAVQATVLIKKVRDEGPLIDLSTFIIVDIVCPVLFEVVTAAALVWKFVSSWSFSDAFLAYVQMGFWFLSAYLVLWMVAHFWSSRNSKMRTLVSNYRRRRRNMRRALNQLERNKRAENLWLLDVGFRFYYHVGIAINPMGWFSRGHKRDAKDEDEDERNVTIQVSASEVEAGTDNPTAPSRHATRMERIREMRARVRAKNPWHAFSFRVRAIILLVAVIASALLSLWSFMVGWPIMGLFMIALSSVIQQRFPQVFGRAFRYFITTFVVVSLVFFSSAFIIGTFTSTGSFQLGPFQNGTSDAGLTHAASDSLTINGKAITFDDSSQYPACSIDYDGLSVLDFALMADAAYGATTEEQVAALTNRFNGTALGDYEYVARNNASDYQVWMELYFPAVNVTVVAVRGTASVSDALEDMHFWFGITIMQAVNVFVPFLRQLPRKFVLRFLSMNLLTAVMPDPVYTDLLNHVVDLRARKGGGELVLTGHSLGGAIAAMVGAKTKTRAVSFSGPGLLYSLGRFGIEAQDVRDYVLTMKPRKDIVPLVDELGGMVQEIRCKHSSPMSCHSTTTHLCELYYSCGDARGRNWNSTEVCIKYGALPDADDDA